MNQSYSVTTSFTFTEAAQKIATGSSPSRGAIPNAAQIPVPIVGDVMTFEVNGSPVSLLVVQRQFVFQAASALDVVLLLDVLD
jgi:hypothetical protein